MASWTFATLGGRLPAFAHSQSPMTTDAVTYQPISRTSARADRLMPALLIAVLLHAALLAVKFSMPAPSPVSKSIDVTIATFKSAEKPKEADFLAQHDQQGSGTLEEKATPKTDQLSPFQDSKVNVISSPPPPPPEAVEPPPQITRTAVATQAPARQKLPSKPVEQAQPAPPAPPPAPKFDSTQLSEELATLEAQLSHEREMYAKRPRIHRINAATTMRDKGAWYKEEWRRKIERVGNLNYPEEARRRQIYGSLRLLVSINRDGSLREVTVLESSGQAVLDQAALRIVRLAAPFSPFTGDLNDVDILEIVRTWRFERGDRLSSQ